MPAISELPSKRFLFLVILILLFLALIFISRTSQAYDNKVVHPYIAEQAFYVWPNDPSHEIFQYLDDPGVGNATCESAVTGNKIISGMPTVGQTTNFSVTVTDSTYPDSQSHTRTLSLRVSTDLTIMTTAVLPNARLGSAISPIVLVASGGPSPYTWQLSEGYLPDGITLDPDTGTLSGTQVDWGDFIFRIQVTDGDAQTAEKEFFWHISDTLAIVTPAVADGAIDDSYSFLLEATGGIKPYIWSIVDGTLPSGLSLNSVTGVISGTPTALQTYAFTVRVADNDNPAQVAEKEFVMEVSGDLMIFTDALPIMRVDQAFTANIAAKLGRAPYSWSIESGSLPPGLTLIDSSYMATLERIPTMAGTYTFAIEVTDTDSPAGSAVKTFTVPVYEDFRINTTSFPSAVRGEDYSEYIDASGGKAGYTYRIVDGKLPFGLKLNSTIGLISGAAKLVGAVSSTFTLRVIDSGSPYDFDEKKFTIYVVDAPPLDSDSDGLPDDIEAIGCTEPDDPDSDDDGLLDGTEDANHNGSQDLGETNPCDWDSDDDDMPDGWEVANGLDPLVDDASDDKDLDGFSNIREYVAGTNADDINDTPTFAAEIEDFETGDLSQYPWLTAGDALWSVTDTNAYSSTNAAQAGAITDNQSTSLEISRYTEAGDFSFWYAVDSEAGYDWLNFYIDGALTDQWSGSVPYTQAIYPLTNGMHYFMWEYVKDKSDLGGSDTAWINTIVFPGFVDSDGDGMPDGWETDHNLTPLLDDADADADNDLFTNHMECLMGTDPRNPSDYPILSKGFDADMDVDGADLTRMADGLASGVVTQAEVEVFAEGFGR